MEPALKQRVVGACVLVALAVIFLPMLVKGPAPESGVSDVPLKLPDAPAINEGIETRELPLVTPGSAPASGVVGMDASAPADAGANPDAAEPAAGMLPATTAGGDYAVSFGRYATVADADRVIAALRSAQLPGYQEATTENARTLYRVRIGPFTTQADAEAARLRAAHVRDDVGAKVVVLNADASAPADTAPAATPASPPVAAATPAAPKVEPLPETKPATIAAKPADTKPAATKPATKPAAPVATAPAKPVATTPPATTRPAPPAAAATGFAVQLGAFGNADEAIKLRDRARAAGLRAFVDSVRTDKGVLSRVRVGPVMTRAEADQLKTQVASKLGVGDAIVKPHP
ncbi:SPOR domain-containing protein [Lysobacter fragariae]